MLGVVVWAWLLAGGQGIEGTTKLAELLPRLVANGQRYEAALPSLSCEETVTSQRVKHGRVAEEVKIEATMRVMRTGIEQKPFAESHVFRTRNGVAVDEGKNVSAPFFVMGGFANGLSFSSMERMACYDITLKDDAGSAALEMEMAWKANVEGLKACEAIASGARRRVTIDRATGHVTRVERTLPAEEARRRNEVFYAAIDYAPVELGAESFWLPVRSEMHDEKDEGRMQVAYSGCRRYAASVTIVGGVEKVPEK